MTGVDAHGLLREQIRQAIAGTWGVGVPLRMVVDAVLSVTEPAIAAAWDEGYAAGEERTNEWFDSTSNPYRAAGALWSPRRSPDPPGHPRGHRMKIIITGSRGWNDWQFIFNVFDFYRNTFSSTPLTVVHGDCANGADRIARIYCEKNIGPVIQRAYPITKDEYSQYGRAAGIKRNERMVLSNLDAHLGLAFFSKCTSPNCKKNNTHPSEGTSHCFGVMNKNELLTKKFYDKELKEAGF